MQIATMAHARQHELDALVDAYGVMVQLDATARANGMPMGETVWAYLTTNEAEQYLTARRRVATIRDRFTRKDGIRLTTAAAEIAASTT